MPDSDPPSDWPIPNGSMSMRFRCPRCRRIIKAKPDTLEIGRLLHQCDKAAVYVNDIGLISVAQIP